MLKKILTTLGPRILGGVASMIAGWVFVHTKGAITVDPDKVVEIGNKVVEIGGTMIGSYALTHRVVSRWLNPGDAAKARLADAEKTAVDTGSAVIPAPPVQ
jgi:hypothetical protein